MDAFRLPFQFEPQRLLADLQQIAADEWIRHYRNDEYEGEWAVAPLRSVAGHPAVVHAVPIGQQPDFYRNTPLLDRCPYFRTVLDLFHCPIGAVRLMLLGAGARILEHKDDMGQGAAQEVRLHIPIQTNEAVHFWLNHQRIPMQVGELWYADFSQVHSVENNSLEPRIHLVLDCQMNDWLKNLLQTAQICHFLQQIGIQSHFVTLEQETFLPGIAIDRGSLQIDLEQLKYPGDLLHEAGHIAVSTPAERVVKGGNITENDPDAMGPEIAAILWSYAAAKAAGISPETVFHPHGYKGASDWHLEQFASGNYIGLPLLTWMGMTDGDFPAMKHWLRPDTTITT
jgi:hypothetical protein